MRQLAGLTLVGMVLVTGGVGCTKPVGDDAESKAPALSAPVVTTREGDFGSIIVEVDEAALERYCRAHDVPPPPPVNGVSGVSWVRFHERTMNAIDVPKANQIMALGRVYQGHDLGAEAAALYERGLALDPDRAPGWHLLGLARMQMGDLEGAKEAFERSLALEPGLAPARGRLAQVLMDLGEVDLAQSQLMAFAQVHPDAQFTLWLMGRLSMEREEWAAALAHFDRALVAGGTNNATIDALRARCLLRLGRTEEARALSMQARESAQAIPFAPPDRVFSGMLNDSQSGTYYRHVLDQQTDAQNWTQAADAARELVRREPQNEIAHFNLSNHLRNLGQLNEAISHARHSISLNPEFVRGYVALAKALNNAGYRDEALEHATKAIELGSIEVEPHVTRAGILLNLKDYDGALRDIEEVLSVQPRSLPAHHIKAMCLIEQEEFAAARATLEQARRLNPDAPWLADLEQRVR